METIAECPKCGGAAHWAEPLQGYLCLDCSYLAAKSEVLPWDAVEKSVMTLPAAAA